jgi:hypothetical protein
VAVAVAEELALSLLEVFLDTFKEEFNVVLPEVFKESFSVMFPDVFKKAFSATFISSADSDLFSPTPMSNTRIRLTCVCNIINPSGFSAAAKE